MPVRAQKKPATRRGRSSKAPPQPESPDRDSSPSTPGAERSRDHTPDRADAPERASPVEPGWQLNWSRGTVRTNLPSSPVPRHFHVVMAGWEFPPSHTGGLGVHCYELCRELGRMGHRVTFLTPFSGPFTPVEGVTFRYPPVEKSRSPKIAGAYEAKPGPSPTSPDSITTYNDWIARQTDLGTADVIHVHDWFGTVGTARLALRMGMPMVMTVHSTEYDRSLLHPNLQILEREIAGLRAADRVVAVSRHLGHQLAERYSVSPEKIRVVYNAVRPPERLDRLEHSKSVVLYLGRLVSMKGVDTFLRAAARVAPSNPEALFVVAGEGPEYANLLTLSAHLGIADRVMFLGKVSEEERSVLLASSSVFVLPSVVEPFGIAALEAMAAGVPTIVSKTSGIAEISQSIFAVDYWDIEEFASRIAELLNYPALRHVMADEARWEALREGWPERALETVRVYAELILERNER